MLVRDSIVTVCAWHRLHVTCACRHERAAANSQAYRVRKLVRRAFEQACIEVLDAESVQCERDTVAAASGPSA